MNDAPIPVRRWKPLILGCVLAVALAGLAWAAWSRWGNREPNQESPTFPLTPISASPFLNTKPEVKYVGSESCRTCHQGDTMAFRRTGMGRSMADIDLTREPPDAVYEHAPSKRRYQVVRKDGQLWHRELLLTAGPPEVVLSEFPVKYVVGSGRHSLTYLVEVDGFMVESPVTWYTSRKAWGMSPGYDTPHHKGFERSVGEGCLYCHAGHAEAVGASLHKVRVVEASISCERCHGPGALHVEHHSNRKPLKEDGIDRTIVNPRHLPRALAEAICQQCHLRASATIEGRRRGQAAFRPGLPLQDFRQDYKLSAADHSMTVVGHVEQMHLSRCYQKSDTLTCLTCHNPHDEPRPADRDKHYNAACATCHKPQACSVSPKRRAEQSPGNSCIHCHMPASPTEIPHLAFTHHRIGIHGQRPAPPGALGPGVLEPFLDLSRLSAIDQKRSLGLGYLEVANLTRDPSIADHYRRHALDLLGGVHKAGLRDPAMEVSLARLRFDVKLPEVESLAARALEDPELAGQDRCNALFLLADGHARRKEYKEALPLALELIKLRRHPTDWILLAHCREKLGDAAGTVAAHEQAVRIDPRKWELQQHLADHFRRHGDGKKAEWHQARAVP